MIAYAILRVVIVYSFSTGTAVLGQEIPGLMLIALMVALIRLRVPRLRRIVDAEQAALRQNTPPPAPKPKRSEPSPTARPRPTPQPVPGACLDTLREPGLNPFRRSCVGVRVSVPGSVHSLVTRSSAWIVPASCAARSSACSSHGACGRTRPV